MNKHRPSKPRLKGDRSKKDEGVQAGPFDRIHDAPRPGWLTLGNGGRKRPIMQRDDQ